MAGAPAVVRLESSDGQVIVVDIDVARKSQTIRALIEGAWRVDERVAREEMVENARRQFGVSRSGEA